MRASDAAPTPACNNKAPGQLAPRTSIPTDASSELANCVHGTFNTAPSLVALPQTSRGPSHGAHSGSVPPWRRPPAVSNADTPAAKICSSERSPQRSLANCAPQPPTPSIGALTPAGYERAGFQLSITLEPQSATTVCHHRQHCHHIRCAAVGYERMAEVSTLRQRLHDARCAALPCPCASTWMCPRQALCAHLGGTPRHTNTSATAELNPTWSEPNQAHTLGGASRDLLRSSRPGAALGICSVALAQAQLCGSAERQVVDGARGQAKGGRGTSTPHKHSTRVRTPTPTTTTTGAGLRP